MVLITAQNTEDKELLQGISNGDSRSIQRIYDLVLPAVIQDITSNNGQESDARDVFQDALMALYKRLHKDDFELSCKLKSYLRIMCRNLWLTKIRQYQKMQTNELDGEKIDLDHDIIGVINDNQRHQLFLKHFDRLGENCRKILSLFFDKKSLNDIADVLETSVNYIKKRKFICKEKLIDTIKQDPLFAELST